MVADHQFSALGLVLLSELAKVARLIRPRTYAVCAVGDSPLAGVMEDGEGDARCGAEDLGEAVARVPTSKVLSEGLQTSPKDRGNVPDMEETGRTVSPAAMAKSPDSSDCNVPIEAFVQVPTRRTGGRKGMNPIDDLFSGLD